MRRSAVRTGSLVALASLWAALLGPGCLPASTGTKPVKTVEKAPAPPPPAARPEPREKTPKVHVHTVQWPGESLSIIAKWYTGAAENWKALAAHNNLQNPDRIEIGDHILIPESLIVKPETMPRSFVDSHLGQAADPAPQETAPREPARLEAAPSDPVPVEDGEQAPELFGPKEFKEDP